MRPNAHGAASMDTLARESTHGMANGRLSLMTRRSRVPTLNTGCMPTQQRQRQRQRLVGMVRPAVCKASFTSRTRNKGNKAVWCEWRWNVCRRWHKMLGLLPTPTGKVTRPYHTHLQHAGICVCVWLHLAEGAVGTSNAAWRERVKKMRRKSIP